MTKWPCKNGYSLDIHNINWGVLGCITATPRGCGALSARAFSESPRQTVSLHNPNGVALELPPQEKTATKLLNVRPSDDNNAAFIQAATRKTVVMKVLAPLRQYTH
jgi:hypothetical protein